jgi:hypothetical protein
MGQGALRKEKKQVANGKSWAAMAETIKILNKG